MYALIMAGGVGTRLWPRSRKQTPKQLLNFISEKTMFQEAMARLEPLFKPAQIFVVTGGDYVPAMRQQVPELPAENYVVEPAGRGTAPCIGLSALYLRRLGHQAVMAVLTADHFIEKWAAFREALTAAGRLARQGYLVTLGIQPTFPATGYGYILRGDKLADPNSLEAYRVERFTEKPDLPTAREFLASGRYYWNSGMFIWRIADVMAELKRHSPEQAVRFAAEAQAAIQAIETEAAGRADLFPGVPGLLAWLHAQGLKLGIITRNCRAATHKLLASLEPLVGVVLTRDDVPAVKPDPLHLGRALERLGVRGERALMVGDHPLDVVTGRAAGAFTAGVLHPGESSQRYAAVAPDLVLTSVLELPAHLEAAPGVGSG